MQRNCKYSCIKENHIDYTSAFIKQKVKEIRYTGRDGCHSLCVIAKKKGN